MKVSPASIIRFFFLVLFLFLALIKISTASVGLPKVPSYGKISPLKAESAYQNSESDLAEADQDAEDDGFDLVTPIVSNFSSFPSHDTLKADPTSRRSAFKVFLANGCLRI